MKIGTRGSDLALAQARYIQGLLASVGVLASVEIIKTRGDRILDVPLSALADERKGFFTKEIEEALLAGEIDVAVHSYKDLPTAKVDGLIVAALPERQTPSEILLVRKSSQTKAELPFLSAGQSLGTSSERRKAQIQWHWPGLLIQDLRGNVPTRIAKLREGLYDGILLAGAGIGRLQASGAITDQELKELLLTELPVALFPGAPAQGALALQCRDDDPETLSILNKLHRTDLAAAVDAERTVLEGLQGGCHLPLGIHVQTGENQFLAHLFLGKEASNNRHGQSFLIKRSAKTSAGLAQLLLTEIKEKPPIILTGREDRTQELELPRKILLPLIEPQYLNPDPAPLARWLASDGPHFIALFSVPALRALCRLTEPQLLQRGNFLVTGKATRAAVEKAFPQARIVCESTDGTAGTLARLFREQSGRASILLPRAREGRTEFQEIIGEQNIVEWEVYRTIPRLATAAELAGMPATAVVVLASPSAVQAWIASYRQAGLQIPERMIHACLGPTTAAELQSHGFIPNLVARQANYESLLHEPFFTS
ncbi:MAG: hydroxymethylbilane synthase [Spirochaetales bacterium]|nr:hydroxymethylbilane synthase [Spirochaetales bacterium]